MGGAGPARAAARAYPAHLPRPGAAGQEGARRRTEAARLARVVAVCDAFDALVNDRPYRARKTLDEAVAMLRTGAGTQWDPEVVSLFASDIPSCARQGAA